MWPILRAYGCFAVEFVWGGTKFKRISANVVNGHQRVVAVETGILQALSHDWTGKLLEFHSEGNASLTVCFILRLIPATQQHMANEVENADVLRLTSPLGGLNSCLEIPAITIGNCIFGEVSPIHREVSDNLA